MNAVGADQQIGLQGHGFTVGPAKTPSARPSLLSKLVSRWPTATAVAFEFLLHPGEQDALQRPPPEGNLGRRKAREAPPGLFPNLLPMAIKVSEAWVSTPASSRARRLGYPRASRCATA